MSEGVYIAILTAVVSIVGSMAATAFQTYKWHTGEAPKYRADAAGEITDTSLALVTAIRDEMRQKDERMAAEIKELQTELKAVREENLALRAQLAELEDVRSWAERLVHQIRSLGHEPVKMREAVKRI